MKICKNKLERNMLHWEPIHGFSHLHTTLISKLTEADSNPKQFIFSHKIGSQQIFPSSNFVHISHPIHNFPTIFERSSNFVHCFFTFKPSAYS